MTPYYEHLGITIYLGDALACLCEFPDESVSCCVTSPPYWGLRDYGTDGQLGLEKTPEEYIAKMVAVFREVRRVLRDDGTLWLNIGDSYAREGGRTPGQPRHWDGREKNFDSDAIHARSLASEIGLKQKDLVGIPWMLAFALRADGWWLRQDIIWSKPNPMPESVTDRCTKSHEYIFMLTKSAKYFFDAEAIKEPTVDGSKPSNNTKKAAQQRIDASGGVLSGGVDHSSLGCAAETRNKRSVWEIATQPFPEAHFATFPEELVKPCILAGCPAGATVLDPFGGSMTTMLVAQELNCKGIAIEINSEYIEIGQRRLNQEVFDFGGTA
jgi:DNA modification methylase